MYSGFLKPLSPAVERGLAGSTHRTFPVKPHSVPSFLPCLFSSLFSGSSSRKRCHCLLDSSSLNHSWEIILRQRHRKISREIMSFSFLRTCSLERTILTNCEGLKKVVVYILPNWIVVSDGKFVPVQYHCWSQNSSKKIVII